MDALMTEVEAAAVLRRPRRTLRQWRYLGRGPAYVKVGARVMYRARDIERWVEAQVRGGDDAA